MPPGPCRGWAGASRSDRPSARPRIGDKLAEQAVLAAVDLDAKLRLSAVRSATELTTGSCLVALIPQPLAVPLRSSGRLRRIP